MNRKDNKDQQSSHQSVFLRTAANLKELEWDLFQSWVSDQAEFPSCHHVARAVDDHVSLFEFGFAHLTRPGIVAANLAHSLPVNVVGSVIDSERESRLPAQVRNFVDLASAAIKQLYNDFRLSIDVQNDSQA